MPYLSTLEVCSRQAAIQIHVYLYLYLTSVINFRNFILGVLTPNPTSYVLASTVSYVLHVCSDEIQNIESTR